MLKKIIKYTKQNFVPIAVTFICIYALYLRLMKLYRHELWADELWQLNQMRGSFLELLKQLSTHEVCSYLSGDYYLIYPFFKMFSFNKWGLAIPHIIVTILGFYLLYLICKRYFKTVWGYLITFVVVCFNGILITYATEIRVYAVLPTLALASLYLTQLLVDNYFQISVVKKTAIGMFFIMLIWFHAYGIIIFFCTLTFALFNRKDSGPIRPLIKSLFKFMLVIFCIAMPLWLYSVFGPRVALGQNKMSPVIFLKLIGHKMSVTDYIGGLFESPVRFMKGVFGSLVGLKKMYFLLLGAIFPFILPFKDRFKLIFFLITCVFIPIALIYILDVIVVYHFVPRQFVWVIPFFALYLGWSWESFFDYIGIKYLSRKGS